MKKRLCNGDTHLSRQHQRQQKHLSSTKTIAVAAVCQQSPVSDMKVWVEARTHPVRSLKTFCLLLCYFSLGLVISIVGPTLLDLRRQVSTDLTTISYAASVWACLIGFLQEHLTVTSSITAAMIVFLQL